MKRVVTSRTLPQSVAEHLRRLIHHGEFGPGDRLPAERDLAEQLGVARASVREALKILQDGGYVEVRRGGARGGTFVTQLSRPLEDWRARMREHTGEIDDVIDFRIGLETHTTRLAAERRSRSDLAALLAAIKELEHVDSLAEFRLADSHFHSAVATAARNARLEIAVQSARGELFSPHDLLAYKSPREETRRDHRMIYDAIRDRDPDLAANLMREHIERTRAQLRAVVFNTELEPPPCTISRSRNSRSAPGTGVDAPLSG